MILIECYRKTEEKNTSTSTDPKFFINQVSIDIANETVDVRASDRNEYNKLIKYLSNRTGYSRDVFVAEEKFNYGKQYINGPVTMQSLTIDAVFITKRVAEEISRLLSDGAFGV